MPGFLADRVLDNGLTVLDTEANRLDITTKQATTYAEATSTYSLGNKTSLSIGAPADGTSGRKVTVAAITDGVVTKTDGTGPGFYAITDTVNSRLLATQALSSTQPVTNGNPFTLPAFDITIPDPTT